MIELILHLRNIQTSDLSFLVEKVFQLSQESVSIDQVDSVISEPEKGRRLFLVMSGLHFTLLFTRDLDTSRHY